MPAADLQYDQKSAWMARQKPSGAGSRGVVSTITAHPDRWRQTSSPVGWPGVLSAPHCHTDLVGRSAVTFDLDGTLVDLRAVYVRAYQIAVRDVIGRDLDEASVFELMAAGTPIRSTMALLDDSAADRLVEVFVERYRLEREGFAMPFPGIGDLIADLGATGVGVAVVTSKLRADALAELESTGLLNSVHALIAFEDTDAHKPDPAPQLAALRAVAADSGVGVGDLPSDVVSARAAGLTSIGVTWGYGTRDALVQAGASCICQTAGELARALRVRLGQQLGSPVARLS
jgi:pyrophosphatase PpaX